jgi:mRNA interferase MazF
MADLRRADVWLGNLDPVTGHEQAGKQPLLIISDDYFNSGRSGLVIVVPITSQFKNIPYHVPLTPPEGGIKILSYVKCEDVRSIATERLELYWGDVSTETLAVVEDRLHLLMSL